MLFEHVLLFVPDLTQLSDDLLLLRVANHIFDLLNIELGNEIGLCLRQALCPVVQFDGGRVIGGLHIDIDCSLGGIVDVTFLDELN